MQDIVDMLQALPHAVTPGPAGPDLAAADVARGHRALRQRRRRRLAGAAGTAAAATAAVVLLATPAPRSAAPAAAGVAGGAHPANTGAPTSPADAKPPLVKLAAYLAAEPRPAGDATLVERETGTPTQAGVTVWDLYTDDGRYFFSRTEAGLPAQVKENDNQGDGQFGREVAAAAYAATGDLDTAALKMAWPYATPAPAGFAAQVKTIPAGGTFDNAVWENCEDALVAGSGSPQVRAGVLRLVSALPDITVTDGTAADGQPTLTLTAGAAELGHSTTGRAAKFDPDSGPVYHEAITINADTGIPLGIAVSPAGKVISTITYTVSRVSLAGIAAGKF
jgi:hypothetical protein